MGGYWFLQIGIAGSNTVFRPQVKLTRESGRVAYRPWFFDAYAKGSTFGDRPVIAARHNTNPISTTVDHMLRERVVVCLTLKPMEPNQTRSNCETSTQIFHLRHHRRGGQKKDGGDRSGLTATSRRQDKLMNMYQESGRNRVSSLEPTSRRNVR
ncbi:Activity-dependent neuroprotector homeobox protein [Anopheles sinensis]|uniref:Activity-dependent neuroprotector homeobox protein n=1 Tax=Anopheles sinensis TaxID=74873 RepID=A0A084WI58_ANOSI|nr:Activity-dependent neuroprotector homeobox protein [Anopheles sinensis]